MAFRFFSDKIPFKMKVSKWFFLVVAIMAGNEMRLIEKTINLMNKEQSLQFFESHNQFETFVNQLAENKTLLKMYYQVDFVFMLGYFGLMLVLISILNTKRTQHKIILWTLRILATTTLVTDIYENCSLLRAYCETIKHCKNYIDPFTVYYTFNFYLKYTAPALFFVLLIIFQIIANRRNKQGDVEENLNQ